TKATSKAGAKPDKLDKAAKLDIQKDGSVLASGPLEEADDYTLLAEAKVKEPITAFRLEVLADPSLPMKGPGRAPNGNFVLNEFKITAKAADKKDDKAKVVNFGKAEASFAQDGFPVANAIDNNPATGWAIDGK